MDNTTETDSSKSRDSIWDIFPTPFTRVTFIILLGVFIGGGFAVFKISNAASYMSDDPKACINCHVMTTQYVTWNHSSHRVSTARFDSAH